jgi:hypothetical protein
MDDDIIRVKLWKKSSMSNFNNFLKKLCVGYMEKYIYVKQMGENLSYTAFHECPSHQLLRKICLVTWSEKN